MSASVPVHAWCGDYNVSDREWQRAGELDAGELVLAADGRRLRIGSFNTAIRTRALAYNIEVADIHTYHVGGAGVLVHNRCRDTLASIGKKLSARNGKNRITIGMGNTRYTMDLQGKAHAVRIVSKYLDKIGK